MIGYGVCKGVTYRGAQKPAFPDPPGLKEQWMAQQGIDAGDDGSSGLALKAKECKRRGRLLPVESFPKDPRLKDGHRNVCRACTNEQARERRARA